MTDPAAQDQPHRLASPSRIRVNAAAWIAALILIPLAAYLGYSFLERTEQGARPDTTDSPDLRGILRQIDPSLVRYRQTLSIETNLRLPRAIAVDPQGRLLVCAPGIVRRFDKSGAVAGETPVAGTANAVVADTRGRLLLATADHVEIYGADGKLTASWPSLGQKAYLTGIALAGEEVWLADAGRRLVIRCSPSGQALAELGRPDPARSLPGLVLPSPHLDVAIDAGGLIWLNNMGIHRMEAYSPDGQLHRYWGRPGISIDAFPGCCNPADFVLLKDGSFVVAEKASGRIKRYSADGQFQAVVAVPDDFPGQNLAGFDLAADAEGTVFVLQRGTSVVRAYVPIEADGT